MRLVTWNCFRGDALARAGDLADLGPDVVVLQECARPADPPVDTLAWFGDNLRHGAAVVVRPPYRVVPVPPAPGDSVFPVRIEGPRAFHLLAVWAKPRPTYVSAVWAGLDAHADWLRAAPAVVVGDFNSHPRWDRGARLGHAQLAARLRDEFGLVSAWHSAAYAAAGAAPTSDEPPTHYHRWRPDRGFHIDYAFVPAAWAVAGVSAWVPDEPAGSRASDHRPLVVEVGPTRADPGAPVA